MSYFRYILCLIIVSLLVYIIWKLNNRKLENFEESVPEQNSLEPIKPKVISNKCVQIIGVGGGGSNIVEYLTSSYPANYNSLIINSDKKALESKQIQNKIFLEKSDGYGCGSDESCGFKLVDEATLTKIKSFINKKRVYVVVTLGGGVGSGSTKAIIKSLYENDIKVHLIAIKPFSWEGSKKTNRADDTIDYVQSYCKKIYLFENDSLKQLKDVSIKQSFEAINEKIHEICFSKFHKLCLQAEAVKQ